MKEGCQILLNEQLRELKLSIMLKNYPVLVRQAKEKGSSYEEFLLSLTEEELQVRAENRLNRRIKEAHFPFVKTLEGFNFEEAVGLDRRVIRELSDGEYIGEHKNVIFLGKSGTGKTHLSIGLGVEACRKGVRTRFVSGCGLVNELIESRSERLLSRMISKYARYDLLIVDELGYVPFCKEGAELLFQILAERHEKSSVIISSNLGFADWTQIFGEATLTAALLDRLTHKAHIINCNWKSYRFKESMKSRDVNFPTKEEVVKHNNFNELENEHPENTQNKFI